MIDDRASSIIVMDDEEDITFQCITSVTIIQAFWRQRKEITLLPLCQRYLQILKARIIVGFILGSKWRAIGKRRLFLKLKLAIVTLQARGRTLFFWYIHDAECYWTVIEVLKMLVKRVNSKAAKNE
jgi:hypothetical protein